MDSQNYSSDQDEAEEEERLSFCDLPMYSDPAEWENISKEDRTLSSSLPLSTSAADQLDLFEFFPEEWSNTASTTASSTYPADESIVFCGKLIHFKQPTVVVSDNDSTHQLQSKKNRQKRRKVGLFRWILRLFRRERRRAKSAAGRSGCYRKKTNRANLSRKKNGFPVGRSGPVLACSSAKSRWYLLMFGLRRLPAEMELRDMRSRQQRRRREVGDDRDEKLIRAKWLWRLITALGCGCFGRRCYHQANLAVMD